ncbi:MAG: indole-3-glycerol phosphate synthase TrpC [bacterium]|jgi:indole-3-glycerol phosphate synthase
MNILDTIIEKKRVEVSGRKQHKGLNELQQSIHYSRTPISLTSTLKQNSSSGIIAEFKRRSPSKGIINAQADVIQVATAYQDAGAAAISVLTDESFFGGSDNDLLRVRPHLHIPILRKEFIIDQYQVHEAKAIGADLILLIAACLDPEEVRELSTLAKSIGLEVLLELHDEDEIGHICDTVDLVGINNRSLKTFDVNIERSLMMSRQIPQDKLRVAESGIDDPAQVRLFSENGYNAFLIGENFMKTSDPGLALRKFIENI